ncbi:MAG: cell division protein FtsZ [Calditrichaeota bacterium]|nr:cell division protein FtsZ [Calditrichota bacterium]
MITPLTIKFADEPVVNARMKVVGVGGAGGNAVDRMILSGMKGVEFITINTDAQALDRNLAPRKVQIGKLLTRGLGAGANPEVGKKAAVDDTEFLREVLAETDLVFITAGMGGGTGTGAAPHIAQLARDAGALTVAIVTKPFIFEGRRRMIYADTGIKELRGNCDTLVVIPNQRLLSVVEVKTTLLKAFEKADSVLTDATRGITDLITNSGIINLDFADVRTVMQCGGDAMMGIGIAVGEQRGEMAARAAISSPLLEDVSIAGAKGVLVNVTGSSEMTLHEVNEAMTVINEAAGDEANVIFGAVIDDNSGEEIRVTVIATGFTGGRVPPVVTVLPEATADFRSARTQRTEMDKPAIIRRDPVIEPPRVVPPSRIRLEVDLDGEPPADFDVPAFMRMNGHSR